MKITQKYSHLNGEEYLLVHHKPLYSEITKVIRSIDAKACKTKQSREVRKNGAMLYSPVALNSAFKQAFAEKAWTESRYNYYITLNRELLDASVKMSAPEQKEFLETQGEHPIFSYNQTDFVKEKRNLHNTDSFLKYSLNCTKFVIKLLTDTRLYVYRS